MPPTAIEMNKKNHKLVLAALLIFARLFGSRIGQHMLESIAKAVLFTMGVGAGAGVRTSGELGVLLKARREVHRPESLVVFDVGANKGDYIELAMGSTDLQPLVIHAFEPAVSAFDKLTSRWGSRNNVALNRLALGSSPGIHALHADSPGSTLASIIKRDLRHINLEMAHWKRLASRRWITTA